MQAARPACPAASPPAGGHPCRRAAPFAVDQAISGGALGAGGRCGALTRVTQLIGAFGHTFLRGWVQYGARQLVAFGALRAWGRRGWGWWAHAACMLARAHSGGRAAHLLHVCVAGIAVVPRLALQQCREAGRAGEGEAAWRGARSPGGQQQAPPPPAHRHALAAQEGVAPVALGAVALGVGVGAVFDARLRGRVYQQGRIRRKVLRRPRSEQGISSLTSLAHFPLGSKKKSQAVQTAGSLGQV